MTAILPQRSSKPARGSRLLAIFAAQVLLISVALHRFDLLATPVATNLLTISAFGGLAALAMAGHALVRIWREGLLGGGHAVAGALIALLLLAGPLWYLPGLLTLPKINDISTDFRNPPKFEKISSLRAKDANPTRYPGVETSEMQMLAYPDIRPLVLERSAEETFELIYEAVKRLDWEIVNERKPKGDMPGKIEAVTRTLLMGYRDDIAVRVSARTGKARIDVRSASRYGEHDFGANARRIARLFTEIKAGLEKGEREALDVALEKRAQEARARAKQLRALRAKAKKEKQIRLAKLKEEARQQELKRLSELQREALRIEQGLDPRAIQAARKRRARPRARAWDRDSDRFWQQFSE